MKLVYNGPVKECGFTGPVTGAVHVVRPGVPFTVDAADGAALLRRYAGLLVEVTPPASRRKPAPPVVEEQLLAEDEPRDSEEPADGHRAHSDPAAP